MSVRAMNWAFEVAKPCNLSRAEALVLNALAHRHNAKTGQCDPSGATLSRMTNLSRRSVVSAVQGLENKGLIEAIQRRTKRGQISNSYALGCEATSQAPCEDGGTAGCEATSHNRDIYNYKGSGEISSDGNFAEKGQHVNEPDRDTPALRLVSGGGYA